MTSAPDLRYTDRDVREDPSLHNLAVQYLTSYGGEFDPLIRAQRMLESDGELTTLMTRTVLNCMRADGDIASVMPAPRGFIAQPRKTTPPPRREPRMLSIRAPHIRLRFDYLINLHKQARWFHKINHTATAAHYYPPGWWNADHANSIVLWEARAVCGKDLHANHWHGRADLVLGDLIDAKDSGNEYCPKCAAVSS